MEEQIKSLVEAKIEKKLNDYVNSIVAEILPPQEEIIKLIESKLTPERLIKAVAKFIESDSFDYFFDQSYMENVIRNSRKDFELLMSNIVYECLQLPDSKKLIAKKLKENYIENIDDYCVISDLFEHALSGYTMELVPSTKKIKK